MTTVATHNRTVQKFPFKCTFCIWRPSCRHFRGPYTCWKIKISCSANRLCCRVNIIIVRRRRGRRFRCRRDRFRLSSFVNMPCDSDSAALRWFYMLPIFFLSFVVCCFIHAICMRLVYFMLCLVYNARGRGVFSARGAKRASRL